VTDAAAQALHDIMQSEKKEGWVLQVGLDHAGGFCMEFRDKADAHDPLFTHDTFNNVRVSASDLTLGAIGGSTIDFREGRFKLDLPGAGSSCACKDGGECGCA
jgi:Fe-S cluster assembly iron-binding protein IscA